MLLVDAEAIAGLNPVRFGAESGFVKSEVIEVDDESVFFAYQVVRAEWSLRNQDLHNNARIFDKARIKYPNSKHLDALAERVSFVDFSSEPHIDTSDEEAWRILEEQRNKSISNKR